MAWVFVLVLITSYISSGIVISRMNFQGSFLLNNPGKNKKFPSLIENTERFSRWKELYGKPEEWRNSKGFKDGEWQVKNPIEHIE